MQLSTGSEDEFALYEGAVCGVIFPRDLVVQGLVVWDLRR